MAARESVLGAQPFELTGPLPAGPTTTVLEASAGTGKTYAIVGLLTRYVAEGVAELGEMLLITFSRAATQELRERARSRLLEVEAALRDVDSARGSADELIAFLATGDAAEVAARHRRLVAALSDFDAATITTTHGFCQRMLDTLGLAGDLEPGARFVEDIGDLVQEVAEDAYLAMFAGRSRPPFPLGTALQFARTVVANPRAGITPTDADPQSAVGMRVQYAQAVRHEVDRRKRAGRLRDFDDLQGLLRDSLVDPVHGPHACARLRDAYSVVLVDEFQDTDPVQWDILHAAFHGAGTLVLVGDPKQAIYAFRGAEVYSYLSAAREASAHAALDTNRRSDGPLVGALQHLYGDVALGDAQIVVGAVQAHHADSRLDGAPLRLRYLGRNGVGAKTQSGIPKVAGVRPAVLRDVAADITRTLVARERYLAPAGPRELEPGDVAVLVRKNEHIAELQALLQEHGVAAVAAGGSSVFSTAAATDWLRLLQALENPGRGDRARLAALTPLFEFTAADLDERGDALVSEVSGRLRVLAGIFARSGFAAMFDALSTRSRFDERMLGRIGGERTLTDLRHVAELVQHATVTLGLGLAAATRWLGERIADPGLGGTADPARRLATDTEAVQLMTVHASKGLQFPVVYLPFAWDSAGGFGDRDTFTFHDGAGERRVDVGGTDAPGYAGRLQVSRKEDAAEELRLLYVGATRAQSRLVLWWAPSTTTRGAPLHRLLFSEVGGGRVPADEVGIPEDDAVGARLAQWAAPVGASVALEPVDLRAAAPEPWRPRDLRYPSLQLGVATRRIDATWRRTSYSALVADAAHGPAEPVPDTGSEPEEAGTADEPVDEPLAAAAEAGGAPSSLMNGLSGGAVFGTLVHEILEHVDTGASDLAAEVLARCREAAEFGATADDPTEVAAALLAVLNTPLGTGELAGLTLAQVAPADHLAELDFELPLGDGASASTLATIADLLAEYLPAGDPLAPYAERLREVPGAVLRGYLTGSIDSVLRVRGERGTRFTVVDYKTNRLARGDLTTADYTPEAMAREMISSHYVLQALLYSAALHRFLRWKVPGYVPEVNLGPVQYHFVRAMIGPDTPPGAGVFEWQPPAALVVAVSDALGGGR